MNLFERIKSRFSAAKKRDRFQMITEHGQGFYSWNGQLYQSDLVASAVRPFSKAIGKLVAVHIYETEKEILKNPRPYIRFLLEEPNPFMTGQMMQEKVASQLALNNNAFILIVRDDFGLPAELYPIPCTSAEKVYLNNELYLKFRYANGKSSVFPYTEIIHLRNDFVSDDIFGTSPAESLAELMEIITVSDQSIVKAIKNSSVITWILHYMQALRPEDVKENVKRFTKDYLELSTDTFGAAGVAGDCEIKRVEPKDYVPNALHQQNAVKRVYAFFNTNEKIIYSTFTEDEWNSYYEGVIEPTAIQLSQEYSRKLFTRRERSCGNQIYFEASNLQCATLNTKLALVAMVDRGAMTPNEWRKTLNLSPIDGGDVPIRRLDTAPTDEGKGGDGIED